MCGLIIGIMGDNQDKLRDDRVAQHASVCREKARSSQAAVSFILVNAKVSTSMAHASPTSSSCRRHVSTPDSPEAPLVHVKAPEGFGGGTFNLSLMPLYPDHAARHVWDGEVKFNCIHY